MENDNELKLYTIRENQHLSFVCKYLAHSEEEAERIHEETYKKTVAKHILKYCAFAGHSDLESLNWFDVEDKRHADNSRTKDIFNHIESLKIPKSDYRIVKTMFEGMNYDEKDKIIPIPCNEWVQATFNSCTYRGEFEDKTEYIVFLNKNSAPTFLPDIIVTTLDTNSDFYLYKIDTKC